VTGGKAAGVVAAGVVAALAVIVLAVVAATAAVISPLAGSSAPLAVSMAPDLPGPAGQSSAGGPAAVPGIPAPYLADFEASGARTGVPWEVLAGIYAVECDFGRSTLPGCVPGTRNPFGAQGPGQFLPPTWRRGLAPMQLIAPGPPAPDGDGYATDGDGDGIADVFDPADAVASTARMLAANGAPGDLDSAILAYNHSTAYLDQVLALAASYQAAAGATPAAGAVAATAAAGASGGVARVLAFATSQMGAPYLWGGSSPAGWDCSGLVQAAYATVGVVLPHDAAAQFALTSGSRVPLDALRPGDLVFYGSSAATIHHVGIAVDATHMIDAPYTGAVVRIDPVAAPDLLAATEPLG
jgi:cell wall-associated NlpC family hydrolase